MKKIVKKIVKKGIKKAQNGSSLFGPTAAKRAASLRSQIKDEERDYKILQARRDESSYVNREAFADSPLTRTKDSWKNDYYGFSNPSKVGSVKKPNVEKASPAAKSKVTKRAAVGAAKANVKAVRKSFKK